MKSVTTLTIFEPILFHIANESKKFISFWRPVWLRTLPPPSSEVFPIGKTLWPPSSQSLLYREDPLASLLPKSSL